ncbi:uncharacterized protein Smp_202670 [Schistosoma mansoni]|uniref:uncharacterized protein n=1 Tax=Schistosoma mansoni TaxID=6183 RepID=UPI00022DC03D|nr:uncharacterized protein Smp_202670 [Schistosoma mansoni]|eukprot:XP_018651949.1 uncharacterized protein Smp_202670 [Schistosoma mansoni]
MAQQVARAQVLDVPDPGCTSNFDGAMKVGGPQTRHFDSEPGTDRRLEESDMASRTTARMTV